MRRQVSRSQILYFGLVLLALVCFLVPEQQAANLRVRTLAWFNPLLSPFAKRHRNDAPLQALITVQRPVEPVPATQPAVIAPPQADHEQNDAREAELVKLRSEVERLRKSLGSANQTHADPPGVRADVISRNVLWQEPLLGLNRGETDGVRLHAGVTHRGAVAGRIVAVDKNAASMALLTHKGMAIAARLAQCRLEGVLHGAKDEINGEKFCRLAVVAREINVKVGEEVVTSGYDGAFPAGLWLGNVVSMKKISDVQWEILVRPACIENAVEIVNVLTGKPPEVPWPALPQANKRGR